MRLSVALRVLAAALVVVGVVPLANLLTAGRAVPWYGAAARDWATNGLVVLTLAAVLAYLPGTRIQRLLDWGRSALLGPSSRAFEVAIAVVAIVGAAFLAWWCFSAQPFTSDEMAQQFHARVLLSGRLSAQAEPLREFFNTAPVFDRDGRWFSQYPIGGPAAVALGLVFGAPWLVNPVFFGVTVIALYRTVRIVADETLARVTVLLLLVSPMALVMSASQMNHAPALAFATIALWALAVWETTDDRRAQTRAALVAGFALGCVVLVRPLDGALVALIVGVAQALRARAAPARWRTIAVQAIAGAVPIAFLLYANYRTTGSAFLFAYDALNGPEHAWGFHTDPTGAEHTPLRGLTLTSGYLMRLSLYLFEWPLPAVLVIAAALVAMRRPTRWDALFAALGVAFVFGYAGYWFDGFFAGPRFLYTAVPAFVFFVARAPGAVADWGPPPLRRAVVLTVPLCVLVSWLATWTVSSSSARIADYRSQRTKLKTDVGLSETVEDVHNALVFVTEGWRGRLQTRLRVLGATSFRAERILNTVDACALQTALDVEPETDAGALERVVSRATAAGVARPVPNLPADLQIAIVPGSSPTPACLAETMRDSIGTMPYALFLARNRIGPDGRVGGDIVYARDMGARNELLRARFGDRVWYRYRPSADNSQPVFVRY